MLQTASAMPYCHNKDPGKRREIGGEQHRQTEFRLITAALISWQPHKIHCAEFGNQFNLGGKWKGGDRGMGWRTEMRGRLVKRDGVSHVNNIHLEYANLTYNTQYRHTFSPHLCPQKGKRVYSGIVIICSACYTIWLWLIRSIFYTDPIIHEEDRQLLYYC